ncbi:MAG: hypothetical protein LBK13_06115 [Spirochaetales bacterium]|jgi:hypothetical protein|nr:hypothetical protein [Spirochaetales bacterium]
MRKKTLLVLGLAAFAFFACENIFEDTIANTTSSAAHEEALELNLSARNYDAVIRELGFDTDPAAAPPTTAQFGALTTRKKYLLQMALLGKTGFSAVDALDSFMKDDSSDHTSDILLQTFPAGEKATNDVLDSKQKLYGWVKQIKDADPTDDKNIDTAAGISATLNTLMSVMRVANELAGTDVSFNKDDPDYIGNKFSGKTEPEIETAITTIFGSDLSAIQEDIELLNTTMNSLVPAGDTEISKKFDEFIVEFKIPGTNKIKPITSAELAKFIHDQWN